MKLLRKSVSVLLSVVIVFSLFTIVPFEAFAASGIEYYDHTWNAGNKTVVRTAKTCTDYTALQLIESNNLSGWYVVNMSFSYHNRLYVRSGSTANIILCDGCTFSDNDGIGVEKGATLNIYAATNGGGTLKIDKGTVFSDSDDSKQALIGGDNGDCGTINIHGGKLDLNVIRDGYSACIGGGKYGAPEKITIWDGDIKCYNEAYAAAIGGGSGGYAGCNSGEAIVIYGGKINAQAWHGAAIGSGMFDSDHNNDNSPGSIAIYGGEIYAKAESQGAGIGGGYKCQNGEINIYGGDISAFGGTGSVKYTGAGIGSGAEAHQVGTINISGGNITAGSKNGAGIGAGGDRNANTINITGGIVHASSRAGGAGIGGGINGNADNINISNAVVTAYSENFKSNQEWIDAFQQAANYTSQQAQTASHNKNTTDLAFGMAQMSAFCSWISALLTVTSDDESGCGIGGGDDGSARNITISNGSVVNAHSGDESAAIGSGNNGELKGTIRISDSNVTAKSGKYAAAIGVGDEGKCNGTITIENGSTVKANAGTDAAAIGSGDEISGKVKINIKDSTVEAHGGDYASGVGGGDDGDVDAIYISNSIVKAYGGTDGAGIGGGEGGNGGTITITNYSDVYAEGFRNGSAIGGGEGESADMVKFLNNSNVTLDSGYKAKAVYSDYITLYDSAKVKDADSHVFTGQNRFTVLWNYQDVTVYRCEHNKTMADNDGNPTSHRYVCAECGYAFTNTKREAHTFDNWKYVDENIHGRACSKCGYIDMTRTESHNYSDGYCTGCHTSAEPSTLTLYSKDKEGRDVTEYLHKPRTYEAMLPKCYNVPDGFQFTCWRDENGVNYRENDLDDCIIVDNNSVTAIYLPVVDTYFLDESGVRRQTKAAQIENDPYAYQLSGYYGFVANDDITFEHPLVIKGGYNLILADGKTVTFSDDFSSKNNSSTAFDYFAKTWNTRMTIYAQEEQTGTLDLNGYDAKLHTFELCGGVVKAGAFNVQDEALIVRGTFEVDTFTQDDLAYLANFNTGMTIKGGNVKIGTYELSQPLTLGWTKLTDTVRINSIHVSGNGSVTVAEGQALTDGSNIYEGKLTSAQISAMQGKTLMPYLAHNYGEPVWNWTHEYKDATATFTCTDSGCGDVREVSADVTYEDEGDYRIVHATCVFNGKTYTVDQTFQVIFDITVADSESGTLTVSTSRAMIGSEIKVKMTPNEGFSAKGFTVTPEDGSVEIEQKRGSFVMPACNVTVSGVYESFTPRKEPWIDEQGEYHLGNVAYYEEDGRYYAVDEDGQVGEEIESYELSYFTFTGINKYDNVYENYAITAYTGPTGGLEKIVIPKTYQGKAITELGDGTNPLFNDDTAVQFEVVLTEYILTIKAHAFEGLGVSKVSGDTSGLSEIRENAFANANEKGGNQLEITLLYEFHTFIYDKAFKDLDLTVYATHNFDADYNTRIGLGEEKNLTMHFLDAHTCDNVVWEFADDCKYATAHFVCSNKFCNHEETVTTTDVTLIDEIWISRRYSASVDYQGKTYTTTKWIDRAEHQLSIDQPEHGTLNAIGYYFSSGYTPIGTDTFNAKALVYEGNLVEIGTYDVESGYRLRSVTVTDSHNNVIPLNGMRFIMPDDDVTVTGEFTNASTTITYEETVGGWVTGVYSANSGDTVELTVIPAGGYALDTLTVKDSQNNPVTVTNNKFTMPTDDVTVSATFRKIDLSITYEACEGGTVSGPSKAQFNNEVQLTVTPDEGWILYNLYAEDEEWGDPANIIDNVLYMPDFPVTVYAEFLEIVPAKEPWIDEQGEYHLGNVEYVDYYGTPYSVGEDGGLGEKLESVDVSYFDFKLINNDTEYQICHFTGPYQTTTEMVIPKTYNGKPVTVLGENGRLYTGTGKPQFELTLTENIREIKPRAFYLLFVTKVKGDTSGLTKIGDYAFSWANSPGDYTIDVKLDHAGKITTGSEIFNHMNVTLRMPHATTFSNTGFSAQKMNYVFTDDHTYGQPKWTWADDHSAATATFTCTDSRCKHTETVDATVAVTSETKTLITYTATAQFGGATYTDTKEVTVEPYNIGIRYYEHGTVTVDPKTAYEGEEITLTVTPDEGYKLDYLVVFDNEENEIEVTDNKFTMPDSSVGVYARFVLEDGVGARVVGHSISLDGDIAVNFYMELDESIKNSDTAYMQFSIPVTSEEYQSQTVYVKDVTPIEGGYYVFKCRVAAKNMTSTITAQILGIDKESTAYTYSVSEYANWLIEHKDDSEAYTKAAPLVEKMLQYGAYAKEYFDKTNTLDDLGEVSIDEKFTSYTSNLSDELFSGATLSLKSQTTLSLYFTSSDTLTFSCVDKDGNERVVDTAKNGSYQVARIRNIAAKELQDSFTLTVKSGETVLGTITYSPMNYCYKALHGGTTDGNLINAVKALYQYSQAANAYFGS